MPLLQEEDIVILKVQEDILEATRPTEEGQTQVLPDLILVILGLATLDQK